MMNNQQIKIVGTNGQISLGKEFAGKKVLVDQLEPGTWIIRAGEFIPDSERWLYQGDHPERLDQAIEWAEKNPPADSYAAFIRKIKK